MVADLALCSGIWLRPGIRHRHQARAHGVVADALAELAPHFFQVAYVVRDLAVPLPVTIIAELLGVEAGGLVTVEVLEGRQGEVRDLTIELCAELKQACPALPVVVITARRRESQEK